MGEGLGVMEERELVTAVVVEEEDEGEEEDNGGDRDPLIGGQERGVTRSYTYCWETCSHNFSSFQVQQMLVVADAAPV